MQGEGLFLFVHPYIGHDLRQPQNGYVDLLAAICTVVNGAKGVSALQLARDIDCQHKTAFVLGHKLREAMASEIQGAILDGVVEVDGAYVGGYVKPANHKENRRD